MERKLDALLASAEDDDETAFLEEALELLNFTEGADNMELFAVPWDATEVQEDEELEEFEEEDDDEYPNNEDFDDEEWLRYVDDDDDEADNDEYSFGEFDDDRFN